MGHRHKKPQLGLTGGVINFPTNISRIQSALPRTIKDTDTIVFVLKKSLRFKSAYAFGRVNIHKAMKPLKQLCKIILYKLENATIDDNWKEAFLQNQEAYQSSSDIDDSEDDNQGNDEPTTKTLVHGFIDAHTVYDLVNRQINIAPAAGYMPLGIFRAKYSEEMSFPSLFYGNKRPVEISKNFTYQKICHWEVLHKNHDFAYHTTNLFYKATRIIINQVLNTMWIRIRKGQLKGRKLVARDVKSKPNLDRILNSDIGYMDLKTIRTSPDYHQQIRNKLYAMIRQLGPPTFFVSFTSSEHLWDPLMDALRDIKQNTRKPKTNELDENEPSSLIRNDPVTCVRYYRSRRDALHQLISHDHKYYGELNDHFYVTEFQNRGSEHEHGLLWIKSAPIYGQNANIEVEQFVDNYLSTNSFLLSKELRALQHHCHTKSCRKHAKSNCRFNFPIPPMKPTKILEPLEFDSDRTKTHAKLIFETINNTRYNENDTFDRLLANL